jgi:hypothetical protein
MRTQFVQAVIPAQAGNQNAAALDWQGQSGFLIPGNDRIRVARRQWVAFPLVLMKMSAAKAPAANAPREDEKHERTTPARVKSNT